MIQIAYLGKGGRYTAYLQETMRRIKRVRAAEIVSRTPSSHRVVAIHYTGAPLTSSRLREMLTAEDIVFLVGDSTGLSPATLQRASAVVSVSSLPLEHGMEAAIVAAQVEKIVVGG